MLSGAGRGGGGGGPCAAGGGSYTAGRPCQHHPNMCRSALRSQMHTSVNSYDEKYKAVFSHFVESERSAFDRLGIDVAEHMGSMYLGSSGSPTMPVAAR